MAELGLADEVLTYGHRIEKLAFYDGAERRGEVRYSELGGEYPFAVVLPQQGLEDLLEKELAKKKVKVKWNHRLAQLELGGDRASARIEKLAKESMGYSVSTTGWVVDKVLETRARYVVGADGHNSMVRRALGVDFRDLEETLFFGVFEFAAKAGAPPEVRVVLADDTTNVLWPLADGRFRWSFQLADDWEFVPDTRKKSRLAVQIGEDMFPFLSEEKLRELIAERAPWFDAEIGDVRWSVGVRFERRLAERFGRGNAWLVGDAAHLASPVGVQSMNVGIREGHDLARRLAEILHGRGTADLLEAYNTERTREWRRVLGLEKALESGAGADGWVRRRSARIPATIPASGDDLETLLRQLGLELTL